MYHLITTKHVKYTGILLLLGTEVVVGLLPFLIFEGIREYADEAVYVVGALWLLLVVIHFFARRATFRLDEPKFVGLTPAGCRFVLSMAQTIGFLVGAWLLWNNPTPKGPLRW